MIRIANLILFQEIQSTEAYFKYLVYLLFSAVVVFCFVFCLERLNCNMRLHYSMGWESVRHGTTIPNNPAKHGE